MSLRSYAKKVKCNGGKENPINFIPETYWLDDPKEKSEFVSRLSSKCKRSDRYFGTVPALYAMPKKRDKGILNALRAIRKR